MVVVVVSCRQTDPRYRVFPERQLPGRLKQTGVCEGLLGKKSRALYDLLTDPHFHSRSLLSLVTSGKDKLVSRAQMWPSVKSELWLS